jgi:hypothetical protein
MLNCQHIKFHTELSEKRIAKANNSLGAKTVTRIIAFALYLLGAHRRPIAELLGMPQDTLKSFINRIFKNGIMSFEHSRKKVSSFIPVGGQQPRKPSVFLEDKNVIVDFGVSDRVLTIPANNSLQVKTILLTMLNSKLITTQKTSEILGFSTVHIPRLCHSLEKGDVYALIDKRQGQKRDYLFTPEIKAELVQQFAANAVTGKPISSRAISEQIKERCNLKLPDRSIRLHMKKLGLPSIAKSLPALVETLKKTSFNIPQRNE